MSKSHHFSFYCYLFCNAMTKRKQVESKQTIAGLFYGGLGWGWV